MEINCTDDLGTFKLLYKVTEASGGILSARKKDGAVKTGLAIATVRLLKPDGTLRIEVALEKNGKFQAPSKKFLELIP